LIPSLRLGVLTLIIQSAVAAGALQILARTIEVDFFSKLLRAFQGRAAAEFQAAIKDLFEQASLLLSRKDFAIAIRRRC
jgi:hypothetical protein